MAVQSVRSNQPSIQPPDKDSEDGPGRPERDDEGKRQYRNTEHLIHWWAPDIDIGHERRKLEGACCLTQARCALPYAQIASGFTTRFPVPAL